MLERRSDRNVIMEAFGWLVHTSLVAHLRLPRFSMKLTYLRKAVVENQISRKEHSLVETRSPRRTWPSTYIVFRSAF